MGSMAKTIGSFIDMTGKVFGRWTVIELDGRRGYKTYWKCICSCGTERAVNGQSLRNGMSQSCGCILGEKRREKNFVDITGKRFTRWIVIKFSNYNNRGNPCWLCKCDCGNEKVVSYTSLKNGHSQSCGCYGIEQRRKSTFIDLTGKRFGKLTVIEFSYNVGTNYLWKCLCDCGKEKLISGSSLRKGVTNSCGCLHFEVTALLEGEASFNFLFGIYKRNAKRRDISFEIEKEFFRKTTKENCFYCNREPSQVIHSNNTNGSYIYNGLDRINSKLGYSEENIVACCQVCNWRKSNASYDDFIDWIDSVYTTIHNKEQKK